MGFTHYYKIKLYVDSGFGVNQYHYHYETWKYVFADSEDKAKKSILKYYNSRCDTCAEIREIYTYPIQDVMMFNELITT